jgi:hypothetical protein
MKANRIDCVNERKYEKRSIIRGMAIGWPMKAAI